MKLMSFVSPQRSSFGVARGRDVIVTGTPGGVGMRRNPPVWMKQGDVVGIEVQAIGVLRNPIVKESAPG